MGQGSVELDSEALISAQLRRLPKAGLSGKGQIRFPAVPSLVPEFVARLDTIFRSLGRTFSPADLDHLRTILDRKAQEGFAQTPYGGLIVSYETNPLPKTGLSYKVGLVKTTMADEYAGWVKTRTPPLFGSHPDAKVMDLASSLGAPAEAPVLDIGAGTGRNTLPLARAGHPAHAVEVSPDLVGILKAEIAQEGLALRVFEGDVLRDELELPRDYYKLVILCEVVSHFRHTDELHTLFERVTPLLAPGGLLAFSVFLPEAGYEPDAIAREFSQTTWCTLFTRADVERASAGRALELVSDESVFEYEKEHLPAEAWPPTGWFAEWTRGVDLFEMPVEDSPIDMRWLVYRKAP